MAEEEDEAEKIDDAFYLDPKSRPPVAKRGGRQTVPANLAADPLATLIQPCETCGGRTIGVDDLDPELLDRLLAVLRERTAPQTGPGASPIPRRFHREVAEAKKDFEKATGLVDYGNLEEVVPISQEESRRLRLEGILPPRLKEALRLGLQEVRRLRLEEVPRLLPGNPRLLLYTPFAKLFIDYLYFGNPATVRKTLLALHKKALQRQASAKRAMRIWSKCRKIAGQVIPIEEIARAEGLSVSMVKKRLSEARRALGRPARRRNEEKKKNSSDDGSAIP